MKKCVYCENVYSPDVIVCPVCNEYDGMSDVFANVVDENAIDALTETQVNKVLEILEKAGY